MNKKVILFLLILVSICTISHVSAVDDNATDYNNSITVDDFSDDAVSTNDEEAVENSESYHSFTELQSLIDDEGPYAEINLTCDYAYNPKVDGLYLKGGIEFPLDEIYDEEADYLTNSIKIYGNGHTIWGNGSHIFKITSDDSIYLYDLKFVNNNGNFEYGTIYNDGYLNIYNCTFFNNNASYGGAIYNNGTLNLYNSSFDFNTALNDGGAVYNECNLQIDGCSFTNNVAGGDGGAIATYCSASISDSTFSGNEAKDGGAVYNNPVKDGVFSSCDIIGSNFSGNEAEYGGAIFNAIAYCCSFSDDNYGIKYVARVPQRVKNNMQGGVKIDCNEQSNACEGTIDSTGFSFKINKITLLSDSKLSLEVLVTSNPNGEPVSGVGVKMQIGYDDDFDEIWWDVEETIMTDEEGIACINLTYDAYDDDYWDDDDDDDWGDNDNDNDEDEDDEDDDWGDNDDDEFNDLLGVGENHILKYAFENKLSWADLEFDHTDYMEIYLVNSIYNDTVLTGYLSEYIDVDSDVCFTNDIVFDYGGVGSTNFTLIGASGITACVLNNDKAVVTITNNTITVAGLDVGNYVLLVNTIPQRFYNPINATLNVSVRKVSKITFTAGMVFEYGGSGVIHMVVEGGTVTRNNIEVVGHPEAIINLANNDITVSNLPVGTYTLRVVLTPEDGATPATGTTSINVRKATAVITASKLTVVHKKGSKWSIKLVNSKTGKPISNMELTLKVFTGKKYKTVKIKTDSKGIATYTTKKLSKGTHKIIVSATHSGYNFNTVTSSIKVIKPKALTYKVKKKTSKDGASLSITVKDKKTKKPINGVKIKLLIFTGKKYKTVILKTKTNGKYKGVAGYATNKLSVGNHKVKIMPENIKYTGTKTSSMKIKKSAKKYVGWTQKISG